MRKLMAILYIGMCVGISHAGCTYEEYWQGTDSTYDTPYITNTILFYDTTLTIAEIHESTGTSGAIEIHFTDTPTINQCRNIAISMSTLRYKKLDAIEEDND